MSSPLDMLMNQGVWSGGVSPVKPVTDQSDHMTGGNLSSSNGTNKVAPDQARSVLHWAAAIVLGSIILLWLMGAIVLRSAKL